MTEDELRKRVLNIFGVFEEELADSIPVNIDLKKVDALLSLYRDNEREIAKRLQSKIARYGDGEIAYHHGEAYVLISDILALSNPQSKEQQ